MIFVLPRSEYEQNEYRSLRVLTEMAEDAAWARLLYHREETSSLYYYDVGENFQQT